MTATFTNTNIHFSNTNNNLYEYNSPDGTYNASNGDSLAISGQNYIFFNANYGFIFSNSNGTSVGTNQGGCIYALGGQSQSGIQYQGNYYMPVYGNVGSGYQSNGYAFANYNSGGQAISTQTVGTFPGYIAGGNWHNAATTSQLLITVTNQSNVAFYSLVCAYRILCTDEIDVSSDKRIKQNITPLLSNESLNLVRKIEPVSYNHKDFIKRGCHSRFGFIAQDIKEILPSCVNIITDFIPNIYENIEIIDKNTIKLINKSKEDFYLDNLKNEMPIRLKFFYYDKETNKETEKIYTLNKFIDDKIFKLNEEIEDGNIFFYGQEVNDFHVLNYDDINIINISAVKQLDNELQECKKIIDKQQSQIEFLMNEINILKNKIN